VLAGAVASTCSQAGVFTAMAGEAQRHSHLVSGPTFDHGARMMGLHRLPSTPQAAITVGHDGAGTEASLFRATATPPCSSRRLVPKAIRTGPHQGTAGETGFGRHDVLEED
jgi:hypothetical protein